MLLNLADLEESCAALPATWRVVQWGGLHVWKVGPADDPRAKLFAILAPEGRRAGTAGTADDAVRNATCGTVTLKVRPERLPFLRELPGIRIAPYLPRGGWLLFDADAPFAAKEMKAYLADSHAIVAAMLPMALRPSIAA